MDEEEKPNTLDAKEPEKPKVGRSFFMNFLQGAGYSLLGFTFLLMFVPLCFLVIMPFLSGATFSMLLRDIDDVFRWLPSAIYFTLVLIISAPKCTLPPIIFNLFFLSLVITKYEEDGNRIGWLKKSFYYLFVHLIMLGLFVFSGAWSRCF